MFGFIMKTNTFITLSTATANIGVLVGLVFLIFELRQTSAIALSEIRQERTLSIIDEYAMFAQNRQFTSMLHKALEDGDFDSLSKDEWNQVRLYETARMVRLEDVFFQYHKGLIDDSAYDFSLAMAASRLPFWKWLKVAAFNPDFKVAVDAFTQRSDFKQAVLAMEFSDWTKENPSPFRGIWAPSVYE
tara:strand:+ start:5797 stop:6360 length:564 start_codon:yes stop_codon:yes gene_type:complete